MNAPLPTRQSAFCEKKEVINAMVIWAPQQTLSLTVEDQPEQEETVFCGRRQPLP